MIDVTVLLLDQTFSSTAVGPMEVFRHAGSLWEPPHREAGEAAFSGENGVGKMAARFFVTGRSTSSR